MKNDTRVISSAEEIKIFSDPFRLNIINTFRDHDKPLTVTGCADLLGETPAKVLYHVKKLLSIDVLTLDHIEIVNGINAKYYKLTHNKFNISIKDDTDDVLKKNVEYINNIMISQVEQFKMDFITMSQTAIKNKLQGKHDVGWFSYNKLYLSEEEFLELENMVVEYIESKNTKQDDKNEYSMVFGIANRFKTK